MTLPREPANKPSGSWVTTGRRTPQRGQVLASPLISWWHSRHIPWPMELLPFNGS